MAPEDDPEPVGLASSWIDETPARRALAVADDGPVTFQATPVRVDEAFPEYEAYHAAPDLPAFDSGLMPYPLTTPTGMYTIPAPIPAAYALSAAPNPYPTMGLTSQPMTPGPQLLPDIYATAIPPSMYDIETSGSQNDVALMAVGGTFMILKKVLTVLPFVLFAAVITFFALTMGGTVLWAMAGFSWLSTLVALFGRPVNTSTLQRQNKAAAILRMYVGK
jgi:hypothetical protein